MRPRLLRALPTLVAAFAAGLMVVSEVLQGLVIGDLDLASDVFILGIAIVFGSVGWVVASRQPRNPIGWLFLVASTSAGLVSLAHVYAHHYVDTGYGPDLLAGAAAKYGDAGWIPFILLPSTFLLALFPNGHLLTPRWRPFGWCAAVGILGIFVTTFVTAGPSEDFPSIDNPFGVDSPLVDPLMGLSLLVVAVGITGSAASLVVRFRRSRGSERQQIKLLALAGALAGLAILTGIPLYDVLGGGVADGLMMTSVMGLPVAAGIAILRYRLYDIDVVINRALVYGSLTALLAGTYLASVLLLQLALESFIEGSGLAVAVSTLATAALVRPGRTRIQAAVDRRFFRRKYDAAQTVKRFGTRLRERVDLDDIGDDLLSAIGSTLHPAHASLWLRRREETR